MMNNMRVLSLGWGVQSFTLAAMVALGDLPKVDAVIHADTTYESSLTYEFAKRWTPWLMDHGVNVATVKNTQNEIVIRRANGGGENLYTSVYQYAQLEWWTTSAAMYTTMENCAATEMVAGEQKREAR